MLISLAAAVIPPEGAESLLGSNTRGVLLPGVVNSTNQPKICGPGMFILIVFADVSELSDDESLCDADEDDALKQKKPPPTVDLLSTTDLRASREASILFFAYSLIGF